jgi:hypothetical protein
MKLSDFIILSREEKRSNILKTGVPLAKRRVFQNMVFLFQLPEFYVETYCSVETKEIEEFRVFQNPGYLEPYLNEINIDRLFGK